MENFHQCWYLILLLVNLYFQFLFIFILFLFYFLFLFLFYFILFLFLGSTITILGGVIPIANTTFHSIQIYDGNDDVIVIVRFFDRKISSIASLSSLFLLLAFGVAFGNIWTTILYFFLEFRLTSMPSEYPNDDVSSTDDVID